jgi:hypothetical protein
MWFRAFGTGLQEEFGKVLMSEREVLEGLIGDPSGSQEDQMLIEMQNSKDGSYKIWGIGIEAIPVIV